MKEDLVLNKTAQLAKDIGFDWRTREYFNKHGTPINPPSALHLNWNATGATSRPTQCLLAKWLREEKGIDIGIMPDYDDFGKYWLVVEKRTSESTTEIFDDTVSNYYDTFEQGLQEALKYLKENETE